MYNSDFTKSSFGPALFFDNIFDDKFLKEKEFALSPISLDDSIPTQKNTSNNLNLFEKNFKIINDKKNKLSLSPDVYFEKRKSKRTSLSSYGSNIIIIPAQDDDIEECPIISEVNKLIKDPNTLLKVRKSSKKRRNEK